MKVLHIGVTQGGKKYGLQKKSEMPALPTKTDERIDGQTPLGMQSYHHVRCSLCQFVGKLVIDITVTRFIRTYGDNDIA
jgi:hypothetical protein